MAKILVAYFSASGVTARLAKTLAEAVGADLHEIVPEKRYTNADLNWNDKQSRSTLEMKDKSSRPAVVGKVSDISKYDTVFVGFPIWWYTAPTIVNTFLEQQSLTGITVIPFATSGGSLMGETNRDLVPSCKGALLKEGKRFPSSASAAELKAWAESVM